MKVPKIFQLYKNEYLTVMLALVIFGVLCIWQNDPTVYKIMLIVLVYPILIFIKWMFYLIMQKYRK